jgi:D-arabinose 1-dehydrogenase-like Zn-dependent alcohol dehydrogenase
MGRAAGFEVWATSRSAEGRELALRLGADLALAPGAELPGRAAAVFDSVGAATWEHSLRSVGRGGTVVAMGVTTGQSVTLDLLPLIVNQITVRGSIMGTRAEMEDLIRFVTGRGIVPEIGRVLPMERAAEGFADLWEVRSRGKIVLTR